MEQLVCDKQLLFQFHRKIGIVHIRLVNGR